MKLNKGNVFVVSGPSGSGKSTIINLLLKKFPLLKESISATTRNPRNGEVDSKDYFFVSKEEFENMIKDNNLAEFEEVHGNYYGTPIDFILKEINNGFSIIMDIDVYGKKKLDKKFPNAIGLFVEPPNIAELRKRLYDRATDSKEVLELRLKNSLDEIKFKKEQGKYEFSIINDSLELATKEFEKILQKYMEN